MRRLWRTERARIVRVLSGLVALFGGVYLAGLPSYYALFTVGDSGSGANEARHAAVPLFGLWLLIALTVGYLAVLRDSEFLRLLTPVRRRLGPTRQRDAVLHAVALLLADRRFALLRAFKPRIFICDDPRRPSELLPLDVDPPARWQRWRVGYGAVGAAFDANLDDVLVLKGRHLERQNETLTQEQLDRYGSLKLVAAVVLRGTRERPIGTLSVSSEKDRGFAASRVEQMTLLASELGVLLDLII